MSEDDVYERVVDEFELRADDLARLRHYLLPQHPPLDTPEGGRAVDGPEDLADTVRAYYRCTAVALKRAGIASARLDHTGHTERNRARGSSSKGDDIDVAWVLRRADGGTVTLDNRRITRLSWVPRTLDLVHVDGPPARYGRGTERWPAGTVEVAGLLDRLDVPRDASANQAFKALRDSGEARKRAVVLAAVRFRLHPPVPPSGTAASKGP